MLWKERTGGRRLPTARTSRSSGLLEIRLFLVCTRLSPFRQRQIKDRMGMWQEKEKK